MRLRLSNKLKIIVIILLTYISILLSVMVAKGQGFPPQPPLPPTAPCPPNCHEGIPIGDWKWNTGLVIIGIGLFYFINKKQKLNGSV